LSFGSDNTFEFETERKERKPKQVEPENDEDGGETEVVEAKEAKVTKRVEKKQDAKDNASRPQLKYVFRANPRRDVFIVCPYLYCRAKRKSKDNKNLTNIQKYKRGDQNPTKV
jgi:hypothetical protein